MPPDDELLAFFKALADANRLRIVGLLAQAPASVEELAAALSLRPSTVSHHLARLSEAGLVTATVDGHYHVYALAPERLHEMSRRLASPEPLSVEVDAAADAWDRKVVNTFAGPDGRFTKLPMQRKKLQAILRHVMRAFEAGRTYSDKEVNARLREFCDDTATLRRGLVDYRMMAREPDGSRWWVVA
ncbi:MAG: metalloregulator ArsR/SmtB family transcription factor [Alphaproteobacteria bacterium]|nr:metalloregulator ArsR/SmtB family transcription factor [Alphaproteobacteria bacterium]